MIKHTSLYQTEKGALGGRSSYTRMKDSETYVSPEERLLAETVEYQTWRHFLEGTGESIIATDPELAEKSARRQKRKANKVNTLYIRLICFIAYAWVDRTIE